MTEQIPGFGAPERMVNWADEEADKQTESVVETEKTINDKLADPVVRKVITALLAGAVVVGAGTMAYKGYESVQASTNASMEQLDAKSNEQIKKDLINRLHSEKVDEQDIDRVLNDPEIMKAYEEMRTQKIDSFDEYLKGKGVEVGNN